jgi:colanic acid/amylovoran biosynthesis glycosyltransferase
MTERPLVVLHSSRRWLKQTKTWIYQQLKWLPEDIEPHVVCDVTENLDQFPVAHLHCLATLPAWRRRVESLARRLDVGAAQFPARVAGRVGARVLHSHFGPDGFRNLSVAKAARLRHVVTFYGYDVTRLPAANPVWRVRYAELFRRVDRVLCEGPHMRSEILKLGCAPNKAFVQHLGADFSLLPFRPRAWIKGEPLRVLLAGSFREKKGFPDAFLALAGLRRQRPGLKLEITVVGDASATPGEQVEKQRILGAVAETGLGAHTNFLGYRPYAELIERAQGCHLFLSPSLRAADGDTEGGAPVTIVELAASGMPVVSTTHCDIPNVLRGGAARLLAAERDVEGLSQRLVSLVDAPAAWAPLLEETRRDLEQRFDATALGRSLAQHYRDLT